MDNSTILKDARVLVTGGSGFIGSNTVDQLVDAGAGEITVIDNMVRGRPENLDAAMKSNRVKLIDGDIRDRALMDRLIGGSDVVFHQAALRITHCAAEPDEAMAVMVQATYDIFQDCVRHKVKRVVYSSSASIYGLAPHFPTPESDPPYDNRTLYGAAKSWGEGLLRSFHDMYGLDYVALRYFNVYGPRMDLHGRYTEVLVRWMERIAEGLSPVVFGDGAQTLDMIHVRDVARANIHAARATVTDRVYNIGSQTETSLLQLAQLLAEIMDRADLIPTHAPERSVNPVPRRLADCTAASTDLGFDAQINLRDGLSELIDWWKSERFGRFAQAVAE